MPKLIDLLLNLQARPTYMSVPLEEEAPDFEVAQHTVSTLDLGSIDIPLNMLEKAKGEIRFFVDGAYRSATVFEIPCPGGPPVNLIAAHVAVGATELEGNKLRPKLIRQAFIIFLPILAMIDAYRLQNQNPPPELFELQRLPRLDSKGDFYPKVSTLPLTLKGIRYFICDTSLTFKGTKHKEGFVEGIRAAGVVRRWASDMLKEILRSLELGVVWDIRRKSDDGIVLIDGPLARMMFLMYGRLASNSLSWLGVDPVKTYDFLEKVVGVVKVVKDLPEGFAMRSLRPQLGSPNIINISIHKFRDPNKGYHMVSCYTYLRPELMYSFPVTASATSGLVRIDVPLPLIMDRYDPGWLSQQYTTFNRSKLRDVLVEVLALRIPVPGLKQPHRAFTELLPIYETENYLKSLLLGPKDIRFFACNITI